MSKVILITGASSGIGFTTAKSLAEQGHKVYGAARRVEKMEELKTRYLIGFMAKPMVWMHTILPTRWFFASKAA